MRQKPQPETRTLEQVDKDLMKFAKTRKCDLDYGYVKRMLNPLLDERYKLMRP